MNSTWRYDLLMGLLITAVVWGLAEIALRIYAYQVARPAHGIGLDVWEIPDRQLGWKLKPNYHNENTGLHINSQGFRGPELLKETDSVYRIVALGNSTTFGSDLTYPSVLQTSLNEFKSEDCQFEFEVINAGVEGYNSSQNFLHFQQDIILLEPNMVILYFGWNDLYTIDPQNRYYQVRGDSVFNRLLEYSFVLKAASKVVFQFILPKFETVDQDRQELYFNYMPYQLLNNIDKTIDLAHQHSIQVVSITLPSLLGAEDAAAHAELFHYPHYTGNRQLLTTLWGRYNQAILENSRRQNIRVIDLAHSFQAMPNESEYFTDTLHLSDDGYRLVAKFIFSSLTEQDLLPCSMILATQNVSSLLSTN